MGSPLLNSASKQRKTKVRKRRRWDQDEMEWGGKVKELAGVGATVRSILKAPSPYRIPSPVKPQGPRPYYKTSCHKVRELSEKGQPPRDH